MSQTKSLEAPFNYPTREAFSETYANKTCVVSLGHKRVTFPLSSTLCLPSRRMRLRKDQKMQEWLWLLTSNSPRRRPTTTSKDSHRGLVASLVGRYESSEGVAAVWLTTWYELVRQCRGNSSHPFDEPSLAVIEKDQGIIIRMMLAKFRLIGDEQPHNHSHKLTSLCKGCSGGDKYALAYGGPSCPPWCQCGTHY